MISPTFPGWSLHHSEQKLLTRYTKRSRLGFVVLLKFFQLDGLFPKEREETPIVALRYLAEQSGVTPEVFADYDRKGRNSKRDRELIRSLLGFPRATKEDSKQVANWLQTEVLPEGSYVMLEKNASSNWKG